MSNPRLTLALEADLVALPEGPIVVFGATRDTDLSALPKDRLCLVQTHKPDHDALIDAGYQVVLSPPQVADAAVVFLPRAKAEARAMIASAAALTDGPVIVDGQKDAGVDSLYRSLRTRRACSAAWSKAHGKIFVMSLGEDRFDDWAAPAHPQLQPFGFHTAAGVFSADGIDPASALLAERLPQDLGRHVVDLGAGWGYLSTRILERDTLRSLDLVEADSVALECARLNISDARAQFHWADATQWRSEQRLDTVVMNPPFHISRTADPDLGRRFIAAAAAMLCPQGRLFMVANRHLPYEPALKEAFQSVEELSGDNRFKVFAAQRPARPRG